MGIKCTQIWYNYYNKINHGYYIALQIELHMIRYSSMLHNYAKTYTCTVYDIAVYMLSCIKYGLFVKPINLSQHSTGTYICECDRSLYYIVSNITETRILYQL